MDDSYLVVHKQFYGDMYFQRLLEIRNLFDQIANDCSVAKPEQLVVLLTNNIGKLKIASQAANVLLNDIESELYNKYKIPSTEQRAVKSESTKK